MGWAEHTTRTRNETLIACKIFVENHEVKSPSRTLRRRRELVIYLSWWRQNESCGVNVCVLSENDISSILFDSLVGW